MTGRLPPEPYGGVTLADVMPSAAAALGVPGFADSAGLGGDLPESEAPSAVTVLLVDGLGWWPWQRDLDVTPTLGGLIGRRIRTTVPSTTPTALASLGTGLAPGSHGIVGAAFWLPEDEAVLHPLSWAAQPHPVATQPEPTVFERVMMSGRPVVSVGAGAYATSGLTRAVLRGARYVTADTSEDMIEAVADQKVGLTYAYVPDLDRLGHVHGVASSEWRDGLSRVDALVERLLDRMHSRHRLVITADHGMVDCPAAEGVRVEGLPGMDDAVIVAGEPRLRHVYCRPGSGEAMAQAWADELEGRAWVLTRDQVLERGLLGETHDDYSERVGDLVVVARGETLLTSDVDPMVSGLLGQHGSVTDEEMDIPLLLAAGRGHG